MSTGRPIAKLRWQADAGPADYTLREGDTVVIGRSADNAIAIDDVMLSRRHAEVAWDGAGFSVRDLGSTNGTSVNGKRLREAQRLTDGDEIKLDRRTFTFEVVKTQEARSPTSEATIMSVSVGGQPRLVVSAGPDAGQEIPLSAESVTIGRVGRNATWDVRLSDRTISRPHVRIQREGVVYMVSDLGSANGTQVNGQKLSAARALADGDVIAIGETRLVFRTG